MKHRSNDQQRPGEFRRYLRPRDAAQLIGVNMFGAVWNDADLDALGSTRDAADPETWDRANAVEIRLERLLSQGELRAFGDDDEGTLHDLPTSRVTTPWFRIDARRGSFLVFPDRWASFFVDGRMLAEILNRAKGKRPRKTQTFEWLPVANEAWRFALDEQALPRTQASLVGHLQQWYLNTYDPDNAPDVSELSALAKVVVGVLGDRRLS